MTDISWIPQVLMDLREFAEENDLPTLAESIDPVIRCAEEALEIGRRHIALDMRDQKDLVLSIPGMRPVPE